MTEGADAAGQSTIVERIAREAGALALEHFHALAGLPVERKGHLDLVTAADREVEAFLTARLQAAFPQDGVFGEEGGETPGTSERIWVIDPIDGTFNFVRGGQNWAISIGLLGRHRPIFGIIYAPLRDLLLCGGQGLPAQANGEPLPLPPPLDLSQAAISFGMHPSVATADRIEVMRFISDEMRMSFRSSGSATASLIEVALGETDGYLAMGDSTWDVVAGLAIVESLGLGHTLDWEKTGLDHKLRFACGGGAFIAMIRPLLDKIALTAARPQ